MSHEGRGPRPQRQGLRRYAAAAAAANPFVGSVSSPWGFAAALTFRLSESTRTDDENPELVSFTRRFWWTLPLTVIVTTLAMFGHQLGGLDMATQSRVELALSLPVVLWAGWPFFARGAQSVVQRSPNMWTLISLGTGAAFVYSVVATLAPAVLHLDGPRGGLLRGSRGHRLADPV